MKRILPESELSAEQLNTVKKLAAECDLCEETVRILFGRGFCDRESINTFLHPSKSHFISPYKMSGMREAVSIIKRAREEGWVVLVYGDYDADGVCATSIMDAALREFGIEPVLCIPERRDGYGLSVSLIDEIFEQHCPQLVITVDCGISCAEEVKYIKEQGAEVIVTDHHELPETIPDCICVNPKFNDGYIYDNLCGAGVAFKVACALLGEKAYKFLDYAAIATVADSVPLTGENRDIVYEGLKMINSSPRPAYSGFLKADSAITAQSLAFSVAPKINAAGRMGDAKSALQLFTTQNKGEAFDLSAKLTEYNLERQRYCDELYVAAKEQLIKEGSLGKIIVLCNDGWNAGFVGIVAARLADEYCRPAILFVRHGDMLRGSARSVEGVNVYEALRACSQYIDEFGGHAQAAGVNVTEDNFEKLKNALSLYMEERYTDADFIPTVYVSGELDGEFSPEFARELELFEPCGVGNKKPQFIVKQGAVQTRGGKLSPSHLSVKSNGLEFMFFGGGRFSKLFASAVTKSIIFEYNISQFRGREYVKGFVRDFVYNPCDGSGMRDDLALNALYTMALPDVVCESSSINEGELGFLLSHCPDFGTLFIAWDKNTLSLHDIPASMPVDLFVPSAKSCLSGVLLSPQSDVDLNGYSRIIFLDDIGGYSLPTLAGRRIEKVENAPVPKFIKELSADRGDLLSIFATLTSKAGNFSGSSAEDAALSGILCDSPAQAAFALSVFSQLGLISFEGGAFKVFRGIKTDLRNSALYEKVTTLQSKGER